MSNKSSCVVPLLDLTAQYARIEPEIVAAVTDVLRSQVFIGGPHLASLEKKVAEFCGCRFAVGVSSGTDALLCTLMSLDIGPGDEVITTPFTFFATVGSIVRTGAKPVFVDIDPRTFNLNPSLLEAAVSPRTKAIIPVHLFGQMAEMDSILRIARSCRVAVIEDAAQAIGASYQGRQAGTMGTAGCFSFFPAKNLGGAGDGGMVVTDDERLWRRLTVMRNHGADPKYFHPFIGGNFRLDAIQAAILEVKLRYLPQWCSARRAHAEYYNSKLAGSVQTPWVIPEGVSTFNQYVIRTSGRDDLMQCLKRAGVGCEVYYPLPMHLQPCFSYMGFTQGAFPEAESASREALAIPVYPELTDNMLSYVADAVVAWANAHVTTLGDMSADAHWSGARV